MQSVNKYIENKRNSLLFFFVLWTLYMIIYMTKNCYSAAMASIVSEGVLTKSQTGVISAAFWFVYAAFQIVGGYAADKFKPAMLIFIGVLGAAVANLIIFFNHNYIVMIVVWTLNAIVQFGVWPAIFKIISTQLSHTQRTKAIFYIGTSNSVAFLVSYIVAASVTGWEYNFLISAVALFITAFAWLYIYPYFDKFMVTEVIKVYTQEINEENKVRPVKLLFVSGLFGIIIIGCMRDMLNSGIRTLTPVMIMETYNMSPSIANILNILLVVIGAMNVFIAGAIHPKPFKNELSALFLLLVLALPILIIISGIGKISLTLALISLSIAVALLSSCGLFTGSYLVRYFSKYGCGGSIAGIVNAGAAFGAVLANYIFTKVADDYGWGVTTKLWIYIGIACIILTVLMYPLWKKFISNNK